VNKVEMLCKSIAKDMLPYVCTNISNANSVPAYPISFSKMKFISLVSFVSFVDRFENAEKAKESKSKSSLMHLPTEVDSHAQIVKVYDEPPCFSTKPWL
jgi:hypothetical protein